MALQSFLDNELGLGLLTGKLTVRFLCVLEDMGYDRITCWQRNCYGFTWSSSVMSIKAGTLIFMCFTEPRWNPRSNHGSTTGKETMTTAANVFPGYSFKGPAIYFAFASQCRFFQAFFYSSTILISQGEIAKIQLKSLFKKKTFFLTFLASLGPLIFGRYIEFGWCEFLHWHTDSFPPDQITFLSISRLIILELLMLVITIIDNESNCMFWKWVI